MAGVSPTERRGADMKPNILIIFADQMRSDTMGCAGHPVVKTPNLDRLAGDGVMFTNAYSPDPVCVPARASLATGNYPHKCTGIKSNGGRIRDNQIKIADFFARNGYATYASGKLHYVPYAAPGEPRLLHGFQYAALAESGRILKHHDQTGSKRGLEDYHDYLKDVGWAGYERAHGVGNNDIHPAPSPLPEEHYVDSWVCTKAIEFLDVHETNHRDKPFFMFMSFPKPHAPYDPPRPFDAMYEPREIPLPFRAAEDSMRSPAKQRERITHGWDLVSPQTIQVARACYYGQVTFQDKQVGRMLEYLEKTGRLKDTIVVYSADHGDLMGDFGFFAKGTFYKGSVNVPLLMRWPAKIRQNVKSDSLVGLQDVLPTLASLTELKLERSVDGIDLAPLLKGERREVREFFVSYCRNTPQQMYMVADKRVKYVYSQLNGVEELYDLNDDPDELENIVHQAAHGKTVKVMRDRLIAWARENGDTEILDGGKLVMHKEDVLEGVEFQASSMGWRWY